jgi:DNA polymerase I-like protein with 3'-5' exonuclease and polymerase domains
MAYRIACDKLIDRLESGIDLHTLHAKIMFPGLEITTRRRTLAKNFIYAIRGAGGNRAVQRVLAMQGEYIDLHEIQQWRLRIFAEYPEIPAWIDEVATGLTAQCNRGERRIIRNAFGRTRVLLGYEPIKEALATEISGTSADIMNCVALRLAYEHPDIWQYVVLQIHDSWMVHAPKGIFPTVMNTVRQEMERPVWHWDRFATYPVEAKAGDRWSDLTTWQEAA